MNDRRIKPSGPPTQADFEQDLGSGVEGDERRELLTLALRLAEERPVPRAGLRSGIRSRLLGRTAPASSSRIGALIFGYAASGALLLAVAAIGLVGIGPFAS